MERPHRWVHDWKALLKTNVSWGKEKERRLLPTKFFPVGKIVVFSWSPHSPANHTWAQERLFLWLPKAYRDHCLKFCTNDDQRSSLHWLGAWQYIQHGESQTVILFHISTQDIGTCKEEENKTDFFLKKSPWLWSKLWPYQLGFAATWHMVQDKLSAFFPCICACVEMTAARACLCPGSRHQAGLAVIWGEKGRKAEHLVVASSDASAWLGVGVYTVAAGDSAVAAIVRKLQIDQIVEARLWAYYLGHVNVSLVSSWSQGQIDFVG